jgi:chloramphenicol O-acetyltransferase type A
MYTTLDLEQWHRKDHFNFFSGFDEPFFGVTVLVDCTAAYKNAKRRSHSFFLCYLHASLKAVNLVEAFKYRINDASVRVYDAVHASPTINRPDGSFGFAYMNYHEQFDTFATEAAKEIERVQRSTGLVPAVSGENVIHYSSMPWLNFTALQHARHYKHKDSCPKIAFGKMTTTPEGNISMPVSIHVHHALMDGWHVGQFVELFETLLNTP